jgi:hypothetical protein
VDPVPPPLGFWTQSISTSIVPHEASGLPKGVPDG